MLTPKPPKKKLEAPQMQAPNLEVGQMEIMGIQPKPVNSTKIKLIGDHPLATEVVGGVRVPKNHCACLFLPKKGFVDKTYFISSHPDHTAGATKIGFMLTYEKIGGGIDIPSLNIKAGVALTPPQLESLVKVTFESGRLNENERKAVKLLPELIKQADRMMYMAGKNYVPVVLRGVGDEIEVCVRKDDKVEMKDVWKSIKTIEEGLGVSPLKVKVFANRPKEMERLTEEFEKRGQVWRLYHPTKSMEKQAQFIQHSIAVTPHGLRLYYSPATGERLLTVTELESMIGKYRQDNISRETLAEQFDDLVMLGKRKNRVNQPSLTLFKVKREKFYASRFEEARNVVGGKNAQGYVHPRDHVNTMLDKLLSDYRDATADDFKVDDPKNKNWVLGMYEKLMGIESLGVEEKRIGLGKEFIGAVNWLPGGRVVRGRGGWRVVFEDYAAGRTKDVIRDFEAFCRRNNLDLENINVGEVTESSSKRRKISVAEERGVYVVEWKVGGERKNRVDLLRKQKWDERHYLEGMEFDLEGSDKKTFIGKKMLGLMEKDKLSGHWFIRQGQRRVFVRSFEGRIVEDGSMGDYVIGEGRKISRDDAKKLASEYTQFVVDRHELKKALGLEAVNLDVIRMKEKKDGLGEVDVVFFDRSYVSGVATDKTGFSPEIVYLMGREATSNFALGRFDKSTGSVLYGDGDEIYQPKKIVVADMTGVLGDVTSPHTKFTPTYARWLGSEMQAALDEGVERGELRSVSKKFFQGLVEEYGRLRRLVERRGDMIAKKFSERGGSLGYLRYEWVMCDKLIPQAIERIKHTDVRDIVDSILADESLDGFRDILPAAKEVFA